MNAHTGVGTRACSRVSHNTVTRVTRYTCEDAPMFQQVLPLHIENERAEETCDRSEGGGLKLTSD